MRNDAFCGIMPEIAAEKKGSGNPEVPADIVILFVLMSMTATIRQKIRAVQFVVLLRENGQLKMTIFISLRRAMMFLTVL